MISYVHNTSVYVADQRGALDFYVNVLGFEQGMEVPMGDDVSFLTVVPARAKTQISLSPLTWFMGEGEPSKMTGICLATENIDETYETYTSRGVKFKGPVEVMPWGSKAAWFYDLEGNAFFLVEDN